LHHLILAGGGHAHLAVLDSFRRRPAAGVKLTLVTPHPRTTYTGMVPGVIAGQYQLAQAQIDVERLARQAGGSFVAARVTRIDAAAGAVTTEDGQRLRFDLLSLDIGSQPAEQGRIRAAVAVVKPIEEAVAAIEAQLRLWQGRNPRFGIVGGGAGGVDLAFAIARRLRTTGGQVIICDSSTRPLSGRHPNTSAQVAKALHHHRITFLGGVEVEAAEPDGLALAPGTRLKADAVVWATGAAGHALLRDSALPVDERGFLLVGDDLRSREHPQLFAAGDCATLASHPRLPKAGVYAVRQGPVLAANLRAAIAGKSLEAYRPQSETLALLNTGDGRAILSYGARTYWGRAAWWLKHRIDRRFVAAWSGARLAPD